MSFCRDLILQWAKVKSQSQLLLNVFKTKPILIIFHCIIDEVADNPIEKINLQWKHDTFRECSEDNESSA